MVYLLRAFAVVAVWALSAPLWGSSDLKAVSETVKHPTGLDIKFVEQAVNPRPASVPSWAKCPEHWETARLVGWRRKDMRILDRVIYRESRCISKVHNPLDPSAGSRGLTQINGFWHKILKQHGVIGSADDLYDPETNLRAALLIHSIQTADTGWGWSPWAIEQH